MSGPVLRGVDAGDLAAGHFSPEEREVYESAGYGQVSEPGRRPALLVVDVTYAFTGDPLSDVTYPLACGPAAWISMPRIERLIDVARSTGIPIVYSRNSPRPTPAERGGWAGKVRAGQDPPRAHDIVDAIRPRSGDLVITKTKPSAFFSTPLAAWLIQLGVDTVLIAGGSTSGCVRATALDAFSYNLNPFVVRDATFDRSATSHAVNLFELHQKYATVTDSADVQAYMRSLRDL